MPLPPPPPTRKPVEPNFPGLASGMNEILRKQDTHTRTIQELSDSVGALEARVVHHGVEIKDLKNVVREHGQTLEEHHERLVDIERLPRHKSPTAIVVHDTGNSIPPLPVPTKTGNFPKEVVEEAWREIEKQVSEMRSKLHDQELAAKVAAELQEKAEKRNKRLLGWLGFTLSVLAAVCALFAYLAPKLASLPS